MASLKNGMQKTELKNLNSLEYRGKTPMDYMKRGKSQTLLTETLKYAKIFIAFTGIRENRSFDARVGRGAV